MKIAINFILASICALVLANGAFGKGGGRVVIVSRPISIGGSRSTGRGGSFTKVNKKVNKLGKKSNMKKSKRAVLGVRMAYYFDNKTAADAPDCSADTAHLYRIEWHIRPVDSVNTNSESNANNTAASSTNIVAVASTCMRHVSANGVERGSVDTTYVFAKGKGRQSATPSRLPIFPPANAVLLTYRKAQTGELMRIEQRFKWEPTVAHQHVPADEFMPVACNSTHVTMIKASSDLLASNGTSDRMYLQGSPVTVSDESDPSGESMTGERLSIACGSQFPKQI